MNSAPPTQSERHVTLTVALAVLGVFVTYVPITSVSVSLSTIGTLTAASSSDLQWISDAYVIPMAAAVLSAGVIGDLHGRRRTYVIGMALTVLGGVVAGLGALAENATAVRILWTGQAVSGVGAGLLLPTTLALIAHAVPDFRARGRYISMWATGIVLGLAAGPILAGVLLEHFSWGWIYAPTVLLAAFAGIFALLRLPESKAPEGRHLDWPGQFFATLTVAASIFGVIEGGASGWSSLRCLLGLIIGGLALVGLLVVERRSSSPMLDLGLFRSPQFSAAGASALVALFAIVGTMFLVSLFLGFVQHLSPLQIGVRLLFVSGVSALGNPLVGKLMGRARPIVLLGLGLLLCGVGLVLISGVDERTGFADLVWRFAIFGLSMSFMLTPVSVVAVNSAPWQKAGMAAATNTALRQYGGALGPAVLGVVYAEHLASGSSPADAMSSAVLVTVVLVALAGIACLVIATRGRSTPAAA